MTAGPSPSSESGAPGAQRVAGGRFSLYADGGRLVLAMALDGDGATHHWVIPKTLLRLAARQIGGDPVELLRRAGETR